jgi:hypothetical protein
VLWLLDTRSQSSCVSRNSPDFIQTNRAHYVMLAEATKGQLTCDDIRWNSRYSFVHYDQAGDLLARVPGCKLSDYELLVALAYGERPFAKYLRHRDRDWSARLQRRELPSNPGCENGRASRVAAGRLRQPSRQMWAAGANPPRRCATTHGGPTRGLSGLKRRRLLGRGRENYGYASDGTLLDCEKRSFSNLNFYYPWAWGTPRAVNV